MSYVAAQQQGSGCVEGGEGPHEGRVPTAEGQLFEWICGNKLKYLHSREQYRSDLHLPQRKRAGRSQIEQLLCILSSPPRPT